MRAAGFSLAVCIALFHAACDVTYTAVVADPSKVIVRPGLEIDESETPLLDENETKANVMDKAPPWMSVQLHEHKNLLGYDVAALSLERPTAGGIDLNLPGGDTKMLVGASGKITPAKAPVMTGTTLRAPDRITLYYESSSYTSGDTTYYSSYEFFLPVTYETDWSNVKEIKKTNDVNFGLGLGLCIPHFVAGVALTLWGGILLGTSDDKGTGGGLLAGGIAALGGGIAIAILAFKKEVFKRSHLVWPES